MLRLSTSARRLLTATTTKHVRGFAVRRLPKREDLPEIHEPLSSENVRSGAMRRQLRSKERAQDAAEQQNLPPAPFSEPEPPQAYQQPQYQYQQPQQWTFAESMKQHFISGMAISLAFILVLIIIKAAFGESPDRRARSTGAALRQLADTEAAEDGKGVAAGGQLA